MALTLPRARVGPTAVVLAWTVVLLLMAPLAFAAPANADTPAGRRTGGGPAGTAAEPALTRMRVVDHNIEKRAGALRRAIATAIRTRAEVIALQEVCSWQVDELRGAHPAWTIGFKSVRGTDRCAPRDADGEPVAGARGTVGNVAVWTGGPDGTTSNHTFGPQRREGDGAGLACVSWKVAVRHRACSVHLISPGAPEQTKVRTAQAKDTRRVAARWLDRDDLVVLAGDFNALPGRQTMKHLYAFDGPGGFRESSSPHLGAPDCRCATSTTDGRQAKIDYVFYSANRTAPRAFRRLRTVDTVSDHHLLVGWADMNAARR